MGRSRRDSNQEDYSGSTVICNQVGNKIRMSASATTGQRSGIHRRITRISLTSLWLTVFIEFNKILFKPIHRICLCGGVQYPGYRQDDHNPVFSAEQRTSGKSEPDVAEYVEVYLFRYWKRLGRSGLQSLSTRKHWPVFKQVNVRGRSCSTLGCG
jgi:hypothetical protein